MVTASLLHAHTCRRSVVHESFDTCGQILATSSPLPRSASCLCKSTVKQLQLYTFASFVDISHGAWLQFQLQSLQQQQQYTEQLQQAALPQQHQLPGPGPSISFAPEAEPSAEAETSRKPKRGPVWKRKHLVIEQINELIDELDEIDGNIALQVPNISSSCIASLLM